MFLRFRQNNNTFHRRHTYNNVLLNNMVASKEPLLVAHHATAEPVLAKDAGNLVRASLSLSLFFQVKCEVNCIILTIKSNRMREWWLILNTVTYL